MWAEWRFNDSADANDRLQRMELREFMHRHGFNISLGNDDKPRQTRLWGSGSIVSLEGKPTIGDKKFSYDGDVNVLMLGVDVVGSDDSVMGIAASTSDSEIDFGEEGIVERRATTVHPYLSWRLRERMRVWLSAGGGGGSLVNKQSRSQYIRDVKYALFAGGLSASWKYDEYDLSLGGNVSRTSSELEALDHLDLAEAKFISSRLEAQARASRSFVFSARGISLRPFVNLSGRRDGGDIDERNAFDFGGGIEAEWEQGMQAEISGRWQLSDDDEASEKSITGRIIYDFGSDGRGLQLQMSPDLVQRQDENGHVSLQRELRAGLGYVMPVRVFGQGSLMEVSADASYGTTRQSRSYGWKLSGSSSSIGASASDSGAYRINWSWR